jgi:hypothetical protein
LSLSFDLIHSPRLSRCDAGPRTCANSRCVSSRLPQT